MIDHEDLKWIAATSTNLNSMLLQIARYTDLARRYPDNHHYVNLVGERVDLATKTAQALFDKVTSNILEKTAVRAANRRKAAGSRCCRPRCPCRHRWTRQKTKYQPAMAMTPAIHSVWAKISE